MAEVSVDGGKVGIVEVRRVLAGKVVVRQERGVGLSAVLDRHVWPGGLIYLIGESTGNGNAVGTELASFPCPEMLLH